MKFIAVASLVSLVSAASVDLNKRDSPLNVKLEVTGTTAKAVVTNTGSEDLKVFKTGSFLDDKAVEKVQVFKGESKVAFEGIRLMIQYKDLAEDNFQTLAAGKSLEATFDLAELHDLSVGGSFDIKTAGQLSYAAANSNELAGSFAYSSNVVSASVDGAAAEKTRRSFLDNIARRSAVQSDCTSTRRTSTVNALANCATLARAAASAATSNSAKLNEYFKSTSSSVASAVSSVFSRVATECASSTSGVSRTYCTDVYGNGCASNVLAYTLPSGSYIVNCPLYFSALPALTRSCHAQDQATTTLHETTHLTQIKGTQDLGYGYTAATRLSSSQAQNNADSYALFANAIYAGC